MPLRPSLPSTLAAIIGLLGAVSGALVHAPAGAASLGQAVALPVLGQPLDFVVPLRLAAGETLDPRCVSSEVALGERTLASASVRTTLEATSGPAARVRVISLLPVDEPVVTLTVTVGCTSSVSRRYVLFADPPGFGPAAPPATAALPVATTPAFAANPEPLPATASSEVAVAAAAPASETVARPAPPAVARDTAPAARPTPPRRPAAPRRSADTTTTAQRSGAAERRVATAPARTAAPRLKLEAAEPVLAPPPPAQAQVVEEALAAVAQAASAARAAAAAASAAAERISDLERRVAQLRSEAQAEREQAARLRDRLAASDAATRWVTPLLVLVLILAGVALWLAWRVAALQRRREVEWRTAVGPTPAPPTEAPSSRQTAPIPFVVSEIVTAPNAPPRAGNAPAWPPPAPLPGAATDGAGSAARTPDAADDADPLRTRPLSGPGAADRDATRDVSIEELIDLEQQAEFFVVLGQDDAAIDLLVEHLRQTGGVSPLPYLKLLEIYGRRGDREAYERMRARFNRRFNAYAPEWGVELSHGRTLADYPGVIPRLQQVWSRPVDAMAELESLLFRKDRGELFDLPAYREVLFLYSLARDLLDRESIATGSVDLLLPMADGSGSGSTAPQPYAGTESDLMPLEAGEERATMPVDLDLSRPEPPSSIFDPPEDLSTRPRSL